MSSNPLPEIAIAPNRLALANPTRVSCAVDDGDDVRSRVVLVGRAAVAEQPVDRVDVGSGAGHEVRHRAADRVRHRTLAGGAARARRRDARAGPRPAGPGSRHLRAVAVPSLVEVVVELVRQSQRHVAAGAVEDHARVDVDLEDVERLMSRLTVKSPATPVLLRISTPTAPMLRIGSSEPMSGPIVISPTASRRNSSRARVEVDAQVEDAVDAGDVGDLEVARELHLDEGALEVDDHPVERVTRVQRDSPGAPSLPACSLCVLVGVLVVGEAGLEVDRRDARAAGAEREAEVQRDREDGVRGRARGSRPARSCRW